jgi:hypothetical protein
MATRFAALAFACAVSLSLGVSAQNAAVTSTRWIEAKSAHFSIFYQAGYEKDAAFTQAVLNRADRVMDDKYGVTIDRYYMSVYLYPEPTENEGVSLARNQCCTRGNDGISLGTIYTLAPSAPAWKASDFKSSLGFPKNDENYHAKIMMSEYITVGHYAVQDSRSSGGWRYYSAPHWFVQGLQEYDAIFHSTDFNRTAMGATLLDWARNNRAAFSCCAPSVTIADDYNGGATFIAFLAAQFGEDIHARLLRSSAKTFEEALADETKPNTTAELFGLFQKWLDTGPMVRIGQ